ncbi:histidine kinase [Spirosoma aureum]|uniref:Histidine kinase n=1 Tax=Spirosoma aureum TaxID=2692134 RepID=A0A6G9AQ15_9BACT|nr:sensor histidine kinase [Spirosoma aureum]QIP14365.1 histidine kinase [Spirosoma aureum]
MIFEYQPDLPSTRGCKVLQILLLIYAASIAVLSANAQPFMCRQFSANDGLPSSYCFASLQDRDGYLWVGTYGGVGRFDGATFKNFTVNNGLVNNQALSLFQDKDQNIWIGTFNGISIWKQGRFQNITSAGNVPIERVFGITQDRDGRIWATSAQGLLCFDNPGATPKLFQRDVQNQPVSHLWGVSQLPSGQLLVSNTYHLFLFDKNRFTEVKYPNGKPIEARCLVRIGNRMLIGTYEQGILEYKSGTATPLYSAILPSKLRVFDILTDKRQRLWLATNQGAICIDKGKVTQLNTQNSLPSDKCLGISKDTEGNIWLTSPEGLIQCRERFIDVFTKANGLLNDEVYSLGKDKNGIIYFGGCNGAFTAYQRGRLFQPFPSFTGTKPSGLPIHFTRFDHKGNLWLSCDADGVFKFSSSQINKITSTGKFCSAFLEDTLHDIIWMGNREKLFRYQQGQWTTIDSPPAMAVDDILALYQDKQNRIWIGTYGLRIFDGKRWTDVSKKTNTEQVFIQSIKTDSEGAIWVGTIGKGIRKIRLDEKGAIVSVETITTRQGLQNDSVLDLEFDHEGQLWVGSFGGIMRIDLKRPKEKGQFRSRIFNRNSGILDNTWQIVSFLKDNDGNLWAGTSKGAMRFVLSAIPKTSMSPPVHIVSAQLAQNTHEPSTGASTIVANEELPYFQNSLNFQFTGISLSDPSGIRYTYKLAGLPGASWSALSSQNSITANNLSPNAYVLHVKAINADGVESRQEATFAFTITPPFWQTWWFRSLLALLVASAIWAIVQIRIRFLNEKHKTALQISEWKLKALQSQMNPHFIFNSLNSIQNFIITNKAIEGVKYLSKFSKLVRKILENSNYQQMKLEQVIETLKMYVELEAMRFNNEFSYQFIIDDADSLYDTLLPPMLFQPFVENAIWHGLMPKTGDKLLRIQVEKQADTLLCIIEDNGVGRAKSSKKEGHTSRGESITKDTFDAFNQQMGKEATLTIIDKVEPLTGTRVEIRIPL